MCLSALFASLNCYYLFTFIYLLLYTLSKNSSKIVWSAPSTVQQVFTIGMFCKEYEYFTGTIFNNTNDTLGQLNMMGSAPQHMYSSILQ